MSMLDNMSRLIDCAKRLRGVAEALDAADLKAQIVEELLRLHEIRDALLLSVGDGQSAPGDAAVGRVSAEPRKLLIDADAKIFQFDADVVSETYSLHVGGLEGQPPTSNGIPAAAAVASAQEATSTAGHGPTSVSAHASPAVADKSGPSARRRKPASDASDTEIVRASETAELPANAAGAAPSGTMSEQERFALAEQWILELEPLHQAALRKMNDLLTEQQRRIKVETTRAATKAGSKGRELQQIVMAALHLTPEQQQRMAAARKELLDVRQAIARQAEGLLSKEQLERLLQYFAKKYGS